MQLDDVDLSQFLNVRDNPITGKIVFGDPVERNGTIVIPAARISGGAGGGRGDDGSGAAGSGGGYGLVARPVGALVLSDDGVRWEPAIDLTRVILGGQLLVLVAMLVFRSIIRTRNRTRRRLG